MGQGRGDSILVIFLTLGETWASNDQSQKPLIIKQSIM